MIFLYPEEAALATSLLVFMFGVATLPLNYVYSFLFTNHSTAQITIMGFNFVTGFCCVIGYQVRVCCVRVRAPTRYGELDPASRRFHRPQPPPVCPNLAPHPPAPNPP